MKASISFNGFSSSTHIYLTVTRTLYFLSLISASSYIPVLCDDLLNVEVVNPGLTDNGQAQETETNCEFEKAAASILNIDNGNRNGKGADVRNLECGGQVNLPLEGTVFLQYNSSRSGNLGEKQNCLWILQSRHDEKWYRSKLRISLLCDKLDEFTDTLTMHEWMPASGKDIISYRLRTNSGSEEMFPPDYLKFRHFLYLNSKLVLPGAEFILKVDIVEVTDWGKEANLYFNKAPGRVDFNDAKDGGITSVAIVPPNALPIQFTIERVITEQYVYGDCNVIDSLDIYELGERGKPRRLGRFCRNVTDPISYSTENPVIALLDKWSPKAFSISWK